MFSSDNFFFSLLYDIKFKLIAEWGSLSKETHSSFNSIMTAYRHYNIFEIKGWLLYKESVFAQIFAAHTDASAILPQPDKFIIQADEYIGVFEDNVTSFVWPSSKMQTESLKIVKWIGERNNSGVVLCI